MKGIEVLEQGFSSFLEHPYVTNTKPLLSVATPQGSNSPFSRCCCLLSFLLVSLALLSTATLLILLVLKPKKPIFHLRSIQLHSFKLDASNLSKGVSVSSSMASLLFITQNPNKLGIGYSPSEFGVLYETIPIGAVEVPAFYQPAQSKNASVLMHVSIKHFNITDLIGGSHVEMQILGIIGVQLHVLNFPLPRIKVLPSRS